MGYAIEMFFDGASELRIRALWDKLVTPGATSMGGSESRPHVSLAVARSVDVPAARRLLDDFAPTVAPFPLSMESVGFFLAKERVMHLAPKVTPELLELHARFFEQFTNVASEVWEHYSPEIWVPHCTLAIGIAPEKIAHALDACQSMGMPFDCTVVGIELVEFSPGQVKELHTVTFAGG